MSIRISLFLLFVTALITFSLVAIANPLSSDKPAQIIVKFKNEYNGIQAQGVQRLDRTQAFALSGALSQSANMSVSPTRRLSSGAEILTIDGETEQDALADLVAKLNQRDDIEYAEIDTVMTIQRIPDDPRFNEQWHYYEPAGGANLPGAWDITVGQPNVVAAVLDTGILENHSDFAGQLLPGFDFISSPEVAGDGNGRDDNPTDNGDFVATNECGQNSSARNSSWHGTHVAGTIAAATNNAIGVAGVAWNAKLLPVRVLGKCGGLNSDIAEAVRWAAGLPVQGTPINPNPADVINLSLGGPGACSFTMQNAIDDATAAGSIIVVAAGNNSQDVSQFSPGNCNNVITVASNRRDGSIAFYSNFGREIDITAPGGEMASLRGDGVLSVYNQGRSTPGADSFDFLQGTSMAAPHVAGVVALMRSVNKDLTFRQAESVIKANARPFPQNVEFPCNTFACGAGIIDAAKTVQAVKEGNIPVPGKVFTNSVDLPIVDTNNGLTFSGLEVDKEGDSGVIEVSIDIKHPARQDLSIFLANPTGQAINIFFGATPGENIKETITVDATGIESFGEWGLFIIDSQVRPGGQAGFLDEWQIQFP